MSRERLKRIREAIANLPPRTRDVFVLHRFEDMTYKSIADGLGISVSAVEKRIIVALKHLKAAEEGE
jgi:RNA polymerase sigma-70 factor (ECF subfamily)